MKTKPIQVTSYKLQVTSYKSLVTLCLLLAAFCLLPTAAFTQQCNNISIALTPTPSSCQANGTIAVAVSGPDAANLQMATAEYSATGISGSSYSTGWTPAAGTLTNLPPATYRVGFRAYCGSANTWTTLADVGTVTVAGSYTPVDIYTAATTRKSLTCVPSGKITVGLKDGSLPYRLTMTNYPSTYTGSTGATVTTTPATVEFDDLPAGSYTFSVTDNCGYTNAMNVTVTPVSANFGPNFVYTYLQQGPIVLNNCSSVTVAMLFTTGTGNTTHDAYEHYFNAVNRVKYYEVAFNESSTIPPTSGWTDNITNAMPVTLSQPFGTFASQNGRVYVWVRFKGSTCPPAVMANVRLTSLSNTAQVIFANETCTDFTLQHRWIGGENSIYVFGYPYEWRITANSGATVLVNWTTANNNAWISVPNVPYLTGTRIEYRDNCGQTTTQNLTNTSPLDNIRVGSVDNQVGLPNTCISQSLPLTPNGILSTHIQVAAADAGSGGYMPNGTRIEYLGGPPGTPVAIHPDITITGNYTARVYPFSASSITQSTPHPINVPGTYSFRITMPGCPPATVTTVPIFHVTDAVTYTAVETCDGLEVYPVGSMSRFNGTSYTPWATHNTYFAIESAPAGVTLPAAVNPGGMLFFPISGTYVIKMIPLASIGACASSSLSINYTKRQLKLNANVTSAYICSGAAQGFIRVQGMDGSGSYTYELRSENGATLIQSNTAGTFSHGSSGQKFIVRVKDNICLTSFDHPITLLNLNTSLIAYSSSPNNEFCVGEPIQLHCITLGATSYNWTGHNGWTSNAQNPILSSSASQTLSGSYTVTVTPENCAAPMSQTLVIRVHPNPPLPNVPNYSVSLCQNSTAQTIAAITGASVTSTSYTLRYYNSSGGTITSATTVPTSAATVLTYYVSQYNTTTGCESNRTTITVTVNPLVTPTIAISASDNNICSGTSVTYTANITNGGTSPSYQWQINGAPVGGATGSTYAYQPVNGNIISCALTSSANCPTPNPVTSNGVTMVVTPTVTPSVGITAMPD